MEIIIEANFKTVESIDLALKTIKEHNDNQKGMRVYPNEYDKAINNLGLLSSQIKKELKGVETN